MSPEMASLSAAVLGAAALRAAAPIMLAALGGLVSERAGVTNVGLEGLMLVAAFFGVLGSAVAATWLPAAPTWLYPLAGAVLGLLASVLLALLLAVFHLEFGADLIVAGIAINLLASGVTVFAMATLTGDKGSTASLASHVLPALHLPGLARWPVLDTLLNGEGGGGHHVLVLAAIACIPLVWLLLCHTRLGLRLRATGENRQAAIAAGLPVARLQYFALAASGALAGLGGLFLSMGYLGLFQAEMTAGRGFLALAAVFLGGGRPLGTAAAALLFGAASVLAAQLGLLEVPSQLVHMLPPAVTIAALVLIHRRRAARLRAQLRAAAAAFDNPQGQPRAGGKEKTT